MKLLFFSTLIDCIVIKAKIIVHTIKNVLSLIFTVCKTKYALSQLIISSTDNIPHSTLSYRFYVLRIEILLTKNIKR